MKRFQQTQTCALSFPPSQISFDKVFLILMLAAFQLLSFSMNANSNENIDNNTTIEESNLEDSNFTNAEDFTCNGIAFASYKEHDPACGASDGAVRVNVNNPNNYCLVYRLYNYTTSSWHTDYQTSRVFKDLPAGKYRVKMYRDLNCDINNVSTTCYMASDYFYLDCQNLCSSTLTINNNGNDPARIFWWVNTGDQYKAEIQPGESWTTTTYDTYMWRAINTNPDWSNLLYDEHFTVSGCSNQTWNISPNYTGASCTGEINSIQLTNGSESVTLQNGGTYQICDLPSNNYLEAVVSGNHESFHFNVDGFTRNENVAPYNYPAVSNGQTWDPGVGTHNITGTLYSENGSSGDVCDQVSIQINIVDCNNNPPSCTSYKVSDASPECGDAIAGIGAGVFFRRDCGGTFQVWKAGNDLILKESGNGTASLTGSIYNGSTIGQVHLDFTGYDTNGQNWANQCYNDNMSIEYYYTGFSGTVTVNGQAFTLVQKSNGADAVFGEGAHNENTNQFGFGVWMDGSWGTCVEAFGKLTPLAAGDICNDDNPNTTNDVIQNDGCTCAGTINNTTIIKTCDLKNHGISDNHPGETRLLWMDIDGQGIKEYSVTGASTVVEYDDGSALITGIAEQVDNTCNKWEYNVKLINKRNWSQWSALGRSYKDHEAGQNIDHTSFSYYELDNNNSTFTGKNCLSGKTLNITHNPSDYTYGFQVGIGANLKDLDFGLSGWYAFTGSYTGYGDFNGDYDCGTTGTDCSSISENIPGFIYLGENNGSKYFCSENTKTWSQAINLVQANGGEIAIINDATENNFLASNIQASTAWIGYTDENNEGTFSWYNGDGSTYTNWVVGEPNDQDPTYTGADYTVISKTNGKWYDRSGQNAYEVIMEIKCGDVATTVGDFVFNDVNGNGIQEANEFGLPGVTVMLLNADGTMAATTTTDQDGKYIFTNVAPGDYKVKFPATGSATDLTYILTQPNQGGNDNLDSDPTVTQGTNDAMTAVFTVNEGDEITDIDAGYFIASKITGVTWEDKDFDGIQDSNEPFIEGVVVMLLDENGVMVAQTTTDSDGVYTFDNLAPGDYKVKFPVDTNISSTDFSLTTPNVGGNDNLDSDAVPMTDGSGNSMTQIVSVANGQTVDNLDAGYYAPASIGDKVFEDKNGNGIQDPNEPGIDGITVMLLDENGVMITSTTTANGGEYDFTGLTPGTYKIKFPVDENAGGTSYTLTTPNAGGDDNTDSDAVPMTDGSGNAMSDPITVESGDDNNSVDAGYFAPAKLGNKVFEDTNGNGIQDTDEPGIAGVTVMLLDENGVMIASKVTNANGIYKFIDLAPGTYKVKFPVDATAGGTDYTLTTPEQGTNDNKDSDAIPMTDGSGNAMSEPVTLESGDNNNSVDAGYYAPVSIGDKVFVDKNGNGVQDAGDDGIDGITVMLLDAAGNMVATTTTANGGEYEFTDLALGTYKVKFEEAPTAGGNDYQLTTPNAGGNDDLDSDAVPMNDGSGNAMSDLVTLNSGDNEDSIDAGYYIPAKLGNYVFNDTNQNGIQDGGDTGIDGIIVMLLDAAGNMVATTTTANGGLYEFTDLAPGSYKVKFPSFYSNGTDSYTLTFANEGGNASDEIDSDAVAMNDGSGNAMSQLVQLRSGDDNQTIDAGFIELAKVGDFVFNDVNESGIQDAGDLPLGGVTVNLTGTDIFGNAVNETTTTDNDGNYLFDDVVPGDYRLEFNANDATFIITEKDASGNAFDEDDSDIDSGTGVTDLFTLNAGDDNPTIDAGFHFDSSLPVALISFEAQLVNNNEVVLKWATASEEDNKHFIVERSADGRDFEAIGVVEGNGTTNQVNTYSLDDLDPFYGANYYRLKQVDYDGDYEYSQVETVVISGNDLPDVIVYPNPVVNSTTLRVVTPFEQDAQIEIVSQGGQVVQVVTIEAGANSKQLDLSGYSAGVYFAYINFNGHRTLVYNIVKVKE